MSFTTVGALDWYRLPLCRRTLPGRVSARAVAAFENVGAV